MALPDFTTQDPATYKANIDSNISEANTNIANVSSQSSTVNGVLSTTHWTGYTNSVIPDHKWEAVCWSPELGIFVAVASQANGDGVMTSPDGINWTDQVVPTVSSTQWYGVCWSPDLSIFVAVALFTTTTMTSPDGVNWALQSSPLSANWGDVIWASGLGLFVATSYSPTNDKIMTSADGVTWFTQNVTVDNWMAVAWSEELSLLVAVADDNGSLQRVITSTDAITWVPRSLPVNAYWTDVEWSPYLGLFVAIASGNTMYSSDGITWFEGNLPADEPVDHSWRNLSWSEELRIFVAVGYVTVTGQKECVMTSVDGVNWEMKIAFKTQAAFSGICYAPSLNMFCAISSGVDGQASVLINRLEKQHPSGKNSIAINGATSWTIQDIPDDVTKVTLYIDEVGIISGYDGIAIRIGPSSAIVTTGYVSSASRVNGVNACNEVVSTTTFIPAFTMGSSTTYTGIFELHLADETTNKWFAKGTGVQPQGITLTTAGAVALSSTLRQIQIFSLSGSDFTVAGVVRYKWE